MSSRTKQPRHQAGDHRWSILAVICVAQAMVVLDATIVNIALPSAQRQLGFSTELRQWVITAYALAFGSLLLLGGRIGDLLGRKRVLIVGLIGFALASAVGGAAQSFGMLVAARAAQGMFGALLAPSALAELTTTFAAGPDRNRAFAVFTAVMGTGGAIGLLLGGFVTQLLSWRYCLFINLLMALPTAYFGVRLLPSDNRRARQPLDVAGVFAGCGGLFCLVYGFSNAEMHSWSATLTIAMFAAAVVLLTAFVLIETHEEHPLLPIAVVADRARGGSYLAVAAVSLGLFTTFLFATYYLQRTLNFTPIETGLSFLPMSVTMVFSTALVNTKLLPKLGPRPLIPAGMLISAVGLALLAQLTPTSSYASGVLPSLLLIGIGNGTSIAGAVSTSTYRVDPAVAGTASATVNTMQQVAGAIGTALMSTIFASATKSYLRAHLPTAASQAAAAAAATVHGYTVAFWVAATVLGCMAVVLFFLLPQIESEPEPGPEAEPAIGSTAVEPDGALTEIVL